MPGEHHGRFKLWLSRPPRPHGVILYDRRVSFLEVFYDLVYVAVIGQASHQLGENISVRGVVEFAIVFGLIWFAWINGSLYVELHGGEDGRTRNIVFAQMCILTLLAVFTSGAADRDGRPFSLVYAAFLLFMTWLWYTVRDQDRVRPEFLVVTAGYVVAMAASAAVILASGFLAPEPRLVIWAAFVAAWCGGLMIVRREQTVLSLGTTATDSIVAAGAAIVSMIAHAHDPGAPAETAWLLAGVVALGLLALIVIEQSLVDAERLLSVYRPLSIVLAIGAVAALVVGWLRPAPWLLALLLVLILGLLWAFAVLRFLGADAWGDAPAAVDEASPQGDGLVASNAAENR